MAEIRNTFIKSKMNKDLDDRLLSNGEYRDAENVNISRSEGEDVGALENVLGNKLIYQADIEIVGKEIIGHYQDEATNRVFLFTTNYTDSSADKLSNVAPFGSYHQISVIDLKSDPVVSTVLVEGYFLNFSKSHQILGIDLIEDLLFFTDDRNQPRKINVTKAASDITYYTTEDQISVAKYFPWQVPKLSSEIDISILGRALSPDPLTGDFTYYISLSDAKKLKGGMQVLDGGVPRTNNYTFANQFVISVNETTPLTIPGIGTVYSFLGSGVITTSTASPYLAVLVPFGFATSQNKSNEYLQYSQVGSAYRWNTAIGATTGPLKEGLVLGGTFNGCNSDPGPEAPIGCGLTINPGNVTTIQNIIYTAVTTSGANATFSMDVRGTSGTPTALEPGCFGDGSGDINLTVTAGGQNYAAGDIITISPLADTRYYSDGLIPVAGVVPNTVRTCTTSGGTTYPCPSGDAGTPNGWNLEWTIQNYQLATSQIQPPTNTAPFTFCWAGSSVPYTKMKVDSPGLTPDGCFITEVSSLGVINGEDWYQITTNIDHNITPISTGGTAQASYAMVEFSWPNPNYTSSFPGDSDFLKDKFVRFAYRFKFDDGEYSLISPFTQPAFIPKQFGFIQDGVSQVSADGTEAGNDSAGGNVDGTPSQNFATGEQDIQSSTIVSFFENNIDNVDILIESEYPYNELGDKLKVVEIDILSTESISNVIKVLETIPEEEFSKKLDVSGGLSPNTTKTLTYTYQSRKPFREITTQQSTRVYDKVPIRALAQSAVGNRVVYANYIDKHTPPNNLEYNVRVTEKSQPTTIDFNNTTTGQGNVSSNSYLAYPTHTLKQNRNYSVGFIFSDRYGRQSDVILSSITDLQFTDDTNPSQASNVFDGSTVYNPYFKQLAEQVIPTWRGNMLEILMTAKVPSTVTYADGYPGLYIPQETSYAVSAISNQTIGTTKFATFTIGDTTGIQVGDLFRIATSPATSQSSIISITVVTSTTVTGIGEFQEPAPYPNLIIYNNENKLGWYSYKVVVKQQMQDYYNAYVGNVSNLSPDSALGTGVGNYPFSGSSYVTSLLSDNMNKIPADLNSVAPEQNQFGTSDKELFPRVSGLFLKDSANPEIYSEQLYFDTATASINAYGVLTDIGVAELAGTSPNYTGFKSPVQSRGVQGASSDPKGIIITMPNGQRIGKDHWRDSSLGIFEVGAAESNLELYWETSTSGLISDLNKQIELGPTAQPVPPQTIADSNTPTS